jgi:purine-binding chemotaxis protein CheW
MEKYYSTEHEYLVFSCGKQLFSLPYAHLVTVIDSPVWTPVPNAPAHVRGVIRFHEKSIPFYDCRVKVGLDSCRVETEKTIDALKQRKEDHINWINRLKEEVHGGQMITVQTDHHKCAFGRWYDDFSSESPNLKVFMERFDEPHQQIHQIAIEAKKLIADNRHEEAKRLIDNTENTLLKQLIKLFDSSGDKIRRFSYEYGIVIDYPGWDMVAISADSLKRFERFDEVIHPLPAVFSGNSFNFIDAIGRQTRNEREFEDVLIINLEKFLANDLNDRV